MFIGDALDSGPRPGKTSPTLGWSVIVVKKSGGEEGSTGLSRDQIFDENTSKWNFLTYCLKLEKIQRMFPQEYMYFFQSNTTEFCQEFDVRVHEGFDFDLAQYN